MVQNMATRWRCWHYHKTSIIHSFSFTVHFTTFHIFCFHFSKKIVAVAKQDISWNIQRLFNFLIYYTISRPLLNIHVWLKKPHKPFYNVTSVTLSRFKSMINISGRNASSYNIPPPPHGRIFNFHLSLKLVSGQQILGLVDIRRVSLAVKWQPCWGWPNIGKLGLHVQ